LSILEGADDVLVIDAVPHDWLFPRMAAVVHHGGAGTTGAGLQAGIPTIIVPFVFDQAFWGLHLHALGVSPPPIPQTQLTAERLATALHRAVTDQQMRTQAKQLSVHLRAEDGVSRAVELITSSVGG